MRPALIIFFLFSMLLCSNATELTDKQKEYNPKAADLTFGIFTGYTMPVSPEGKASFDLSYKNTGIISTELGYMVQEDVEVLVSGSYVKSASSAASTSIESMPFNLMAKYSFFKTGGEYFFIKAGAGISFNKLMTATFNPQWTNFTYKVAPGFGIKINDKAALELLLVSNGSFSGDPEQDIIQKLNFEGGINYRF